VLFEDKERSFTGPRSYVEGDWEYLDRSARIEAQRVRAFINKWVGEYPEAHHGELISRIRSGDQHNFHSATFEIVLFALFRSLGCTVTVHPDLPAGNAAHPDFLVVTPDGAQAYVEAVLASDYSQAEIAARKRKDAVLAAIDKIDSPNFFLSVDAEGNPDRPPSGKTLGRQLERWLSSLDPDAVAREINERGTDHMPKMAWEHEGWKVSFEAIPKKPERRGKGQRVIGALFGGAQFVNVWEPIRDAVKSKGNRYGELPHPFLVCINVDGMSVDRIDEMQALFGEEEFVFKVGSDDEPEMRRKANGAWWGPQGVQYKRVSGVWIFDKLNPWNVVSRKNCVYFNPWSDKPFPSLLEQVNHAKLQDQKMVWTDGQPIGELLELPRDWPE
jgi:hypothetical protein